MGRVVSLFSDGEMRICFGPGQDSYVLIRADRVEPIAPDACESKRLYDKINRQASEITRLVGRISDMRAECEKEKEQLRRDRDHWWRLAEGYKRNAAYWREELDKLQKEALGDTAPLSDAAKIYIQVSPERLVKIIAEREE